MGVAELTDPPAGQSSVDCPWLPRNVYEPFAIAYVVQPIQGTRTEGSHRQSFGRQCWTLVSACPHNEAQRRHRQSQSRRFHCRGCQRPRGARTIRRRPRTRPWRTRRKATPAPRCRARSIDHATCSCRFLTAEGRDSPYKGTAALAGAAVRAGFTPLLQLQEGVRLPSRHQYTRFPAPLHASAGFWAAPGYASSAPFLQRRRQDGSINLNNEEPSPGFENCVRERPDSNRTSTR